MKRKYHLRGGYVISSVKGRKKVPGVFADAVKAARKHENEYQPPFGVDILLSNGDKVAEIRDGKLELE